MGQSLEKLSTCSLPFLHSPCFFQETLLFQAGSARRHGFDLTVASEQASCKLSSVESGHKWDLTLFGLLHLVKHFLSLNTAICLSVVMVSTKKTTSSP